MWYLSEGGGVTYKKFYKAKQTANKNVDKVLDVKHASKHLNKTIPIVILRGATRGPRSAFPTFAKACL